MAVGTRPSSAGNPARAYGSSRRWLGGGIDGNERLTNLTGAVLIVMLAVLGVTILRLGQLLWLHLFLGLVLIGPLALKLASTGYRFARYYTHAAAYRHKGPPLTALRLLAPAVVITSLLVFASGVALLFTGPAERGTLLPIHKISFIVWLAVTAVHVLGHVRELPVAIDADYGAGARHGGDVTGRAGRTIALAGAIVGGVVLAVLLLPEFSSWMHWNSFFHGHH